MEFIVAVISLVIQSRCVISRHPPLWKGLPSFNPISYLSSDPKIIAGVNRLLLSDNVMQLSAIISGMALTYIVHQGRYQQLHLPALLMTGLSTAMIWSVAKMPPDLIVFVYVPWTLLLSMFVSGQWEVFVREKARIDQQLGKVGPKAE